jgi:hypothetical protein
MLFYIDVCYNMLMYVVIFQYMLLYIIVYYNIVTNIIYSPHVANVTKCVYNVSLHNAQGISSSIH